MFVFGLEGIGNIRVRVHVKTPRVHLGRVMVHMEKGVMVREWG